MLLAGLMKRKRVGFLFLCLIIISSTYRLFGQDTKVNEPLVMPIAPPLHFVIKSSISFPNIAQTQLASQGTGSNSGSTLPVSLELGYAYSDKGIISLFVANTNGVTGNYNWFDTANNPYHYYYDVSIITLGISTEYHFGNNEHITPYIGGMLGYRFINLTSNGDMPAFGASDISLGEFAYQIYGGATWYFIKWMGLDARAGYGNSYYASVGLSFRFALKQDEE